MGNRTLGGSTDDAFRARPLLQGADEVLQRHWKTWLRALVDPLSCHAARFLTSAAPCTR